MAPKPPGFARSAMKKAAMSKNERIYRTAAIVLCATLAFSGCSKKSSSTVPTPPITAVAGDYVGTMTDSVLGTLAAKTTLGQHGTTVGGSLALTAGTTAITEAVAWAIDGSNNVSGSGTATINGSGCSFAMTGAYDPATGIIAGSYTANTGCTGQTGTYSLTQQCTYTPAFGRMHGMTSTGIKPC